MSVPTYPPGVARCLLSLVVPRADQDSVLGDLDEEYAERVLPRRTWLAARVWYWWECMSLASAFVVDRIRPVPAGVGSLFQRVHEHTRRRSEAKRATLNWNLDDLPDQGRKTEMNALFKDFLFGYRTLIKRPASAIISVLVLSIGIGLSTFMFSIVYGVWLRGLDVPEPERLTMIWETNLTQDIDQRRPPVHDLWDWRAQQRSFEGLFGWYSGTINVSSEGADPERYSGAFVTTNMFQVLRIQPVLGRSFTAEDEAPGAPLTVILSQEMWQNRYGGDPDILGRIIKANGEQATIIGVTGERFGFPDGQDIWVPMRDIPTQVERGERQLTVMARLNDGITFDQAQLELESIAEGLAREYPETNEGVDIRLMSWSAWQTPLDFGVVFIAMMVSVIFVLLVACANVANLLLARATLRVKEAAVRTAIGGGKLRVVLPFFSEAVILALASAVLGTLIAFGAVQGFDTATLQFRPFWIEFALDLPVLAFVVATSFFVSIAAGSLPAYQISKADVNGILKDESRGATGIHLGKVSRALVVGEVALSCALMVGSGLMAKNLVVINDVDFPYDAERVFTARIGLFPTTYPDEESRARFFDQLQANLEAHPQFEAAALTTNTPGTGGRRMIALEGVEYETDQDHPQIRNSVVSPGFFEMLDVTLLQGRDFAQSDGADRPPIAIVNRWFAERYYPDGSALGRRFREGSDSESPWITVVGVAPALNMSNVPGAGTDSTAYYKPLQQVDQQFVTIMATPVGGDPMALTAEVRQIVRRLDDDLPIYNVSSLIAQYEQFTFFVAIFGSLFIAFGVITLAIALVGLYGVLSFSVSQRVKEIGVRIALGAQGGDVVRLIVRQGLIQIAVGVVLGLGAGFGLSKLMGNFLFGVEPGDPMVFGGVTALIVAVGVMATWLPARRASAVDPMVALRAE